MLRIERERMGVRRVEYAAAERRENVQVALELHKHRVVKDCLDRVVCVPQRCTDRPPSARLRVNDGEHVTD